jgi:hypothetical protein
MTRSIPTAVPGAMKVFGRLDGREFQTPAAFGDAYYEAVRALWGTLGTAFDTADAVAWALEHGVIVRNGEQVAVRMPAVGEPAAV